MNETEKNPVNPAFRGKKGRSGPPGNTNSVRHGLMAGKLPHDAQYIEIWSNKFRRNLESGVIAARGEVTLTCAALISTATAWTRHGMLCNRWLRLKMSELSPDQLMHFSREIARASSERDKAIKQLDLDRDVRDDIIGTLYARKEPA